MQVFSVELKDVSKKFGELYAVDHLSLKVESGSFVTLLGPSGCGKTTILRMIGGFEMPTGGDIFVMGKKVTHDASTHQGTNMVFQDYALFPHKTVAQNIGFGLKMRGSKKAEIEDSVRLMLDLINLPDVYDRMPHQLSGGQQQRVALARALILKPPVLLLDEPLGALDAGIRKQLQVELKHLQRELGITFIYVTHDQEEAMTMSDVIAIMNAGRLEQLGSPNEVYERPKTMFVAKFIGECNVFAGKIVGEEQDIMLFEGPRGHLFKVRKDPSAAHTVKHVDMSLVLRPEDIKIAEDAEQCTNRIRGKVTEKFYTGGAIRLVIDFEGDKIIVDAPKSADYSPVERIQLGWDPQAGTIVQHTK